MEWRKGDYLLTTDPARVDVAAVHAYLTTSYWSEGIPIEVVRRSIENAIPFSVWWDGAASPVTRAGVDDVAAGDAGAAAGMAANLPQQVAFARVISDRATFAYVGDVYVREAHRGRGLSRWLMEAIVAHPDLQGLRRWALLTRDAHGLYRKFGFTDLAKPDRWMERWDPEVYRR